MIIIDSVKDLDECYAVASIENGLLYVAGAGYLGVSHLTSQWVLVKLKFGKLDYSSITPVTDFVHVEDEGLYCWDRIPGHFIVPDNIASKLPDCKFWVVSPNHRYFTVRERFRHSIETIQEILNMRRIDRPIKDTAKPIYMAVCETSCRFSIASQPDLKVAKEEIYKPVLVAVETDGKYIYSSSSCNFVSRSTKELSAMGITVCDITQDGVVEIPEYFLQKQGWYLPYLPSGGSLFVPSEETFM